jgi:uncharacterized membrane protein YGL010W
MPAVYVPKVNAFHLLVVGPALAFIAWHQLYRRDQPLPDNVWRALLATAVFVMLFHGYKLGLYLRSGSSSLLWSRF